MLAVTKLRQANFEKKRPTFEENSETSSFAYSPHLLDMNSEADVEAYLKQLDTNGLQQLKDRVRQQLVTRIDD